MTTWGDEPESPVKYMGRHIKKRPKRFFICSQCQELRHGDCRDRLMCFCALNDHNLDEVNLP